VPLQGRAAQDRISLRIAKVVAIAVGIPRDLARVDVHLAITIIVDFVADLWVRRVAAVVLVITILTTDVLPLLVLVAAASGHNSVEIRIEVAECLWIAVFVVVRILG
jgi:hypothetical protein